MLTILDPIVGPYDRELGKRASSEYCFTPFLDLLVGILLTFLDGLGPLGHTSTLYMPGDED